MIESLVFKNANNESIELLLNAPHIMLDISGLGTNPVTPQITKGFDQNGVYLHGTNESERIINIAALFVGTSDIDLEAKRRELARIFNPSLGIGELVYTNTVAKYKIAAQVVIKPDPVPIPKTYSQQYSVTFLCPKPDWLSYESLQIKMETLLGGLSFPISFPISFAEIGAGALVEYAGDNPANILIDFRVSEGGSTLTNPRLENDLGEYIEIDKTLTIGQKILVYTDEDSPRVIFEDTDGTQEDAWGAWVYGGAFFQLHHGVNTFAFTAASGDPEAYMTYNIHYGGV